MKRLTFFLGGILLTSTIAQAQLMISGNEGKIDLNPGAPTVIQNPVPDSISILDFSEFPPRVDHIIGVPNTVIGPPSNLAITPDNTLALIANSLKVDPNNPTNTVPESFIHVMDLTTVPPSIIGRVPTQEQPSGLSINPEGNLALVANRASGSVSVLKINGKDVSLLSTVPISEPASSVSDVAISPDGRMALVSVQQSGYLSVLDIDGDLVTYTGRNVSVFGKPYRVVITPDGDFGLTAGQGFGNSHDMDALSVIDLRANPIRTIDYVPIGVLPESIEVHPNSNLVAAVLMNKSNISAGDPNRTQAGSLVILTRIDGTFKKVQTLPAPRIPEGVAFTSDGKYLVVQFHVAKEMWVFRVSGRRVRDTGVRISTPGFPSSLRAAPATP